MNDHEHLRRKLRDDGYRVTRQRQILLEEMKRMGGHPTAKDIYDTAKRRLPALSLGTVYRNLSVLESLGFVRRLVGGDATRYDANTAPHFHITCIHCGRIADVHPRVQVELAPEEAEAQGFTLTSYRLELYGCCSQCAVDARQGSHLEQAPRRS